ncbi:ATP-dependent sacrificial sulfur transferase LarE [Thermodesulfobacteriota bacterium]
MIDKTLALKKKKDLLRLLRGIDSLLIAYSGGVDSTFLLATAQEALGEKVLAVTSDSTIHPKRETEAAALFAKKNNIWHLIFSSEEIFMDKFISNGPDRCYHCKKSLFKNLSEIAHREGISKIAHGANIDDADDFRPGTKAAQEAGALAPLSDVSLGKNEIRYLSREMGLPTHAKPSAACLASRIPYGSPITDIKLKMIERAEDFLINEGLRNVRVRHHGPLAKIEVSKDDLEKVIDVSLRELIVEKFIELGFKHIAVDLEGYSTGKMNRSLPGI